MELLNMREFAGEAAGMPPADDAGWKEPHGRPSWASENPKPEPVLIAGSLIRIDAITEPAAAFERMGDRVRVDFLRDETGGIVGLGLWLDGAV